MTQDKQGNIDQPGAASSSPEGRIANVAPSFATLSDPCFRVDIDGTIRWANRPAETLLARQADVIVGTSARAIFPDAFGATFDRELGRALRLGLPASFEEQFLPLDTWLEVRLYPDTDGATILLHDTADRRRGAERLEDQSRLLEQIARGRPTQQVLEAITGLVERHAVGLVCGIYVVEGGGRRLRLAAAPGLPAEYVMDVAEPAIRPDGCPAGQVAFSHRPAGFADLLTEPVEPTYKRQTTRHGFRANWAMPVLGSDGHILGVICIWRREPGRPTSSHDELVKAASHLSGIALERQQSEADLAQAEQEYRAIFETVQDGLIVTDSQGYVVEVNPAACRLHDSDRAALVGRPAAELVRADYHGSLRRLLDEVRQGREFHGELVCIRRDGSSFQAELTAISLSYKGYRHVLAVVRDVTQRKRMEDSLRRTEDRLRTIVNGAPLVVFTLDKSGVFTLSEGQALAAIGLRPGEVLGQSVFDLYNDSPTILENLRMALSGEPRRFIGEVGERVFETTVRPMRSTRGEIVGISGVAMDVTEQAIAQDALRESEERFRASFSQSPIAIAHATVDGRFIRVNEKLAALLGGAPEMLAGQRLGQWYEPAEPAADDEPVRSLLAGERDQVSVLRPFRLRDGTIGRVTTHISLVRSRSGEARQLVLMVVPIDGLY